jgi:hypothetical protein
MNYPLELKKSLANKMAKVDEQTMGIDFQKAYEYHLASDPFTLLEYWAEYFGAFDNPEDGLLNELNPEHLLKNITE